MAKDNEENTVFIGDKGFFNYTTACEKQLEDNDDISIKARGKYTSRAIDVLEYLKREKEVDVKSIETGTEKFEGDNDKTVFVSTIEIVVEK